jgi:hypothetical protein
VRQPLAQPLLENRLDVHDRKQFELKLEYQPVGTDPSSQYFVDAWIFIPSQLNVNPDTYPRDDFYADIHNYVRLKTPTLGFDEILTGQHSPLVQLEERLALGLMGPESEVVYDAKMLSCVFRGACRRFCRQMNESCAAIAPSLEAPERLSANSVGQLEALARGSVKSVQDVLRRFRSVAAALATKYPLEEGTKASFRLVDEYMSLTVEQFFRKTVVEMDQMPRTGLYVELRKELMHQGVVDEQYRKDHKLRSVISPTGDNEEYTHRIGFLKKFCMNILFLKVRRESGRKNWEEVLFAIAAGVAMAFATAVVFFAQNRIPQASLNFFLVLVVGYMFKDRIKEGARRVFSSFAAKHLYDRTTRIFDPVTQDRVGLCREKVDYGGPVKVPEEVSKLRRTDDFITVSQGEFAETVIRYQKKIVLDSEMLPRLGDGIVTGVTDIIRINIDRLLRDMDDPELQMEYVDLEDFSVGRVKAAKSYQVDLAFRFKVDDAHHQRTSMQLVRLVLDRNGIKRMLRFAPEEVAQISSVLRPVG